MGGVWTGIGMELVEGFKFQESHHTESRQCRPTWRILSSLSDDQQTMLILAKYFAGDDTFFFHGGDCFVIICRPYISQFRYVQLDGVDISGTAMFLIIITVMSWKTGITSLQYSLGKQQPKDAARKNSKDIKVYWI